MELSRGFAVSQNETLVNGDVDGNAIDAISSVHFAQHQGLFGNNGITSLCSCPCIEVPRERNLRQSGFSWSDTAHKERSS